MPSDLLARPLHTAQTVGIIHLNFMAATRSTHSKHKCRLKRKSYKILLFNPESVTPGSFKGLYTHSGLCPIRKVEDPNAQTYVLIYAYMYVYLEEDIIYMCLYMCIYFCIHKFIVFFIYNCNKLQTYKYPLKTTKLRHDFIT